MQKHQPIFLPANYVRLAIGVGGMLILLALLFVFTPSNKVIANGTDMSNALTKYPFISGTRLQSCNLCHTSPPVLNPYGSDYKNNGRNPAALGLIENLDSDGDGFTNLQEISNLFFPGDPNDHPPAVTPTPTQTNTALPPTPTRTNTPPPPTPTRTNTALPPTPTQTSTSLPPTPTSTNTPLPPTPTQTGTSVPPTPTGTSTSLPPTPTGTNTPLPPTATPTNLPPTPTATVLPPTPTQTNTPSPSPTEPSPTPTEPAPTPTQVSPGLDLEICSVSITPRVELGEDEPVIIKVQISKQSDGKERGIAKISGTRNGKVVYLNTQLVDLDEIGDCHWIAFPDYIPTRTRTIRWTLEVVDGNPDIDIRATTTRVYRSTRDGQEERERR